MIEIIWIFFPFIFFQCHIVNTHRLLSHCVYKLELKKDCASRLFLELNYTTGGNTNEAQWVFGSQQTIRSYWVTTYQLFNWALTMSTLNSNLKSSLKAKSNISFNCIFDCSKFPIFAFKKKVILLIQADIRFLSLINFLNYFTL